MNAYSPTIYLPYKNEKWYSTLIQDSRNYSYDVNFNDIGQDGVVQITFETNEDMLAFRLRTNYV